MKLIFFFYHWAAHSRLDDSIIYEGLGTGTAINGLVLGGWCICSSNGVKSNYVVVLGKLCLCKQTPIQEKQYCIHEPKIFYKLSGVCTKPTSNYSCYKLAS